MRKDGKRVHNADPMYLVAPYVMNHRYDAMNMCEIDIPIAGMQAYLNKKRKEGTPMSHLGIVLSAYVRTAAEYPLLNRFVVNKRVYARNEFPVAMVVLKPGETDGTMSKMYLDYTDTIYDVHNKMNAYIEKNRGEGQTNSTDAIIAKLLKIPGLVGFGVGLFKLMDKLGILPKSVIDASPFHTSLVVTNLASIRTDFIYHHLYEFGTSSIFLAMGNMRDVPRRVKGEVVFERCLPMGVVMDERICSGAYFARVFSRFKQYLADPSLLEAPPTVINKDE